MLSIVRTRAFHALVALCLATGCTHVARAADVPTAADAGAGNARMIVVALADKPAPLAGAGSTPRGYDALSAYSGSDRALAEASTLAKEYGLTEVSAWTIAPLHLRCMLYALSDGDDRDGMLQRLKNDRRVRLVQPLQEFETLTAAKPASASTGDAGYNDPYLKLQSGFAEIDAGTAQRYTRGGGVRVALIDAGVDTTHPDLQGRIDEQRDFVANATMPVAADRHGTEVAGVIAAVSNNSRGIVGVAPDAHIAAYRACWPARAGEDSAHCNSYTLALALGAAISSGARIINMSLGGPSDPLLEQLAAYALAHDAVIVGAVPPSGRLDGFPLDVPGVIAVTDADHPVADAAVLVAPGRDILTLQPGDHYDYVSGSSLSAAHVSGALALLLALQPGLDRSALLGLLQRSQTLAGMPIDACRAVQELRRADGACVDVAALSKRDGSTP